MILPIPALSDNYIWLLHDEHSSSHAAWIVDPGEAQPVIEMLKQKQLHLAGILLTHHHWDHTNGVETLLAATGEIPIYGSINSPHPFITHRLKECDQLNLGTFRFTIFEIPGHTLDHVTYYGNGLLFCGDTLFSAGCGRVFEGTNAQMYDTLLKLRELDDATLVYCGHEYTEANLIFAMHIDPDNALISKKLNEIRLQHEHYQKDQSPFICTLPVVLGQEKQINPFLRCDQPEIKAAVEAYCGYELESPVEIFAHLREWKNNFIA